MWSEIRAWKVAASPVVGIFLFTDSKNNDICNKYNKVFAAFEARLKESKNLAELPSASSWAAGEAGQLGDDSEETNNLNMSGV